MPFVALDNEDSIIPQQAVRGIEYQCPTCDDILKVRKSHERDGSFVARHFWHSTGNSNCSGESDQHRLMKSIAWAKAEFYWPSATVNAEVKIGDRIADVFVEFQDIHERYGQGIAIECQYKNTQKDVVSVNRDYLENDCSVLWLEPDAFDDTDVEFEVGDWVVWWPRQVPSVDLWSGYHSSVGLLGQEQPVVEIEIPVFDNMLKRLFNPGWYQDDRYLSPNPDIESAREVRTLMENSRGQSPDRKPSQPPPTSTEQPRESIQVSVAYKSHPKAGVKPKPDAACEYGKDWCMGPDFYNAIYQCIHCYDEGK